MKVLVYGTGVIGTTYGYVLGQAGHDVTHYVRPGRDRTSAGIRIRLLDGRTAEPYELETIYPARIVDGYGPNDGFELILVSLRHYQVPSILYQLAVDAGRADILFFSNWWDDLGAIDDVLAGRYLWGFPVAGGGWIDGVLDGALLDRVHLGEIGGETTERLARLTGLFRSAGTRVELEDDILRWLWVQFATEAGLIASAIAAGGFDALLDDAAMLEAAILTVREALEICRARGVALERIPDAAAFFAPAAAVALGIHDFHATNLAARKILQRHTGAEELQRIYSDVVATGRALGVGTPRLTALGPSVDAWTRAARGAIDAASREPIAGRA